MAFNVDSSTLTKIENSFGSKSRSKRWYKTFNRVQKAVKTLNEQGVSEPNIAQIASEIGISRQQLSRWFTERLSYATKVPKNRKRASIVWLVENQDSLTYAPTANSIRFIGKRELLKAFDTRFADDYSDGLASARATFWTTLEHYGAVSRYSPASQESVTVTKINKKRFGNMLDDYNIKDRSHQ